MTVNLTPASTFPTNFRAPDDGDPANGALFQQCFQDAADAATNLKGRVDARQTVGLAARYTLASGSSIALTESFADAGYSIDSNAITVPVAGKYFASINALLQSTDTSGNRTISLLVRVNGVEVGRASGRRYSTDDSEVAPAQSSFAFFVSDVSHTVTVTMTDGGVGTPSINASNPRYLSLVCLTPTS